jgi:hypothetical protein
MVGLKKAKLFGGKFNAKVCRPTSQLLGLFHVEQVRYAAWLRQVFFFVNDGMNQTYWVARWRSRSKATSRREIAAGVIPEMRDA